MIVSVKSAPRARGRMTFSPQHERGVAIVVVLMLLLVVTLLGLAGIRGALLQERMAANALARAKAFQAAEAVLREAEVVVRTSWEENPNWVPDGSTRNDAQTEINEITSQYSIAYAGAAGARLETGGTGSSANPDLKERLESAKDPTDAKVYRVTVTSTNAENGVEVQLESLYELSRE